MKSPLPSAPCDQRTKSDDIWQQVSCSTHDGQRVRHQFLKGVRTTTTPSTTTTTITTSTTIMQAPQQTLTKETHTHTQNITKEVYNKCMAEIYGLYGISKTTMARITWIIQSSSNPWNGPVPQFHILLLFLMAWKRNAMKLRGDWTRKEPT